MVHLSTGENHPQLHMRRTREQQEEHLISGLVARGYYDGNLEVDPVRELMPHASEGRWCITCPFCNGGEILRLDYKFFMCQTCWNRSNGHRLIQVVIPEQFYEIDEVLFKRAREENQNWNFGDTLGFLQMDNAVHGVEA